MAARRNGGLFAVNVLVGLACIAYVVQATTSTDPSADQQFQDWLAHMSSTSDDISDDTLNVAQTHYQQQMDFNAQFAASTELKGLDRWQAKQQMLRDQATNFEKKEKKDSDSKRVIYVAQDGTGSFSKIQDALSAIPQDNGKRFIIFIKAGTYYERFIIPESQKYIALVGEGADKTIISGDATAGDMWGDDFLRTFRSCTVCVNSDHFVAKNLLIQNTAPAPQPGAVLQQAVALRLSGDKAALYNVAVLGAQDTLYDHAGRHYYLGCFIQGSIDFVFGNGRSYFKDCHLHSIASSYGSLTAQKRNETDQNTGFSFVNNLIDGTGIIYLGRAWGNYSRVVYSWSYLNDMIIPEGWNNWGIWQRESEVYYGQYQCYGPGAITSQRVWYAKQLSDEQAKPFLTDAFINGHSWIEDPSKFDP